MSIKGRRNQPNASAEDPGPRQVLRRCARVAVCFHSSIFVCQSAGNYRLFVARSSILALQGLHMMRDLFSHRMHGVPVMQHN